jgi:large subunit ribosomal protein L21
MNYAVIKSGGKQYKISEGDVIEIDRLSLKKEENVVFKEVLLTSIDEKVEIGKPFLADVTVSGKIIDQFRGVKVRVAKFKAKSRYRRATGFRAELSKVKIDKINSSAKKTKE